MNESIYQSQLQAQEAVSTDTIITVCNYLNGIINSNVKKIIELYQSNPYLYSEFTFKGFSESIDEILTKVITILTQPTRGRRSLSFDRKKDHSIFGKQMYCLLVLFFCTNNKCHPLHYTLTDSIVSHHGSSVLIKIFNRIGACVSLDTHNRIANEVAAIRLNRGIIPYLTPNTLSIITIDNVDILQPYAMISALKSHGWHGTSIQCVQPRPITIKLSNVSSQSISSELTTPPKRGCSSPISSPIPKQLAKRPRTFTENSSHTAVINPGITAEVTFDNMQYCIDYRPSLLSQYTIDDICWEVN